MVSLLIQLYVIGALSFVGLILGFVGTLIYRKNKPGASLGSKFNFTVIVIIFVTYVLISLFLFATSCGRYPLSNCDPKNFYYLMIFTITPLALVFIATYLGIFVAYKLTRGSESKIGDIDQPISSNNMK